MVHLQNGGRSWCLYQPFIEILAHWRNFSNDTEHIRRGVKMECTLADQLGHFLPTRAADEHQNMNGSPQRKDKLPGKVV